MADARDLQLYPVHQALSCSRASVEQLCSPEIPPSPPQASHLPSSPQPLAHSVLLSLVPLVCTASVLPISREGPGVSHMYAGMSHWFARVHLPRWPPGPYSSGVFHSSQDPVSSFVRAPETFSESSRCPWPALSEPWPWVAAHPLRALTLWGWAWERGM